MLDIFQTYDFDSITELILVRRSYFQCQRNVVLLHYQDFRYFPYTAKLSKISNKKHIIVIL